MLPDPFFVLATQNPIEQEGTYPLPEAQLDRFMFMVLVDYPSEDEELEIVKRTTADVATQLTSALSAETSSSCRESSAACRWPITWLATRSNSPAARASATATCREMVRDYVSWGAGPRASQYLILAAKARAVLHGRYYVSGDDIRAVAPPVLRHRIVTNFNAEAEGIKPDDIVAHLAETIPVAEDTRRLDALQIWRIADCSTIHRIQMPIRSDFHAPYRPPSAHSSTRKRSLRLQGLELRARRIVEGYVAGLHRSPYQRLLQRVRRASRVRARRRPAIRRLESFGKTDRFYLKQFEEETNLILLSAARYEREHAVPRAARRRCRSSPTPSARPPRSRIWCCTSATPSAS